MQLRKFFDHLNADNTDNDEKLNSGLKELEGPLKLPRTNVLHGRCIEGLVKQQRDHRYDITILREIIDSEKAGV